jgi:hypothetical protein
MKNPIVNMDAVIQVLGLNLLNLSIFAAVGGALQKSPILTIYTFGYPLEWFL